MITLKEVAKRADVSTATVSKVLSNTPYVSDETRERVLEAIEVLGYTPNLAARALSKGLTYNIGVIFPFKLESVFSDPHILSVVEGIESVCTQRQYNMLISAPRTPLEESGPYQNLVRSGYLDGAVVFETLKDQFVSESLERYHYPWVAVGYKSIYGVNNTIHCDDFGGAKAIAAHFIQLGHRQFGLVTVDEVTIEGTEQRMRGFRAAFEEAGLNFDSTPKIPGDFSVESGYQAGAKLLALSPRPTAILCMNDRMAMGVIDQAKKIGLHVPRDLSVGGFDDIPQARLFDPPLTTIQQYAAEMGSEAAELLFNLIDLRTPRKPGYGEKTSFAPRVYPAPLVIRGSSAPPFWIL